MESSECADLLDHPTTVHEMGVDELIAPQREVIRRIAEKHGATNVRVFDSVARGEAGPDSDVDLLIDAGAVTNSWFPGGLAADLKPSWAAATS